jgi:hypothetical protein
LFGSAVLDVVVGLSLIYFLLSVVTSHINEVVAGVLDSRAKQLEQGIRALLQDPDLANKVIASPLIASLSGSANRKLPSYIPSRTFALALFQELAPNPQESTYLDQVRLAVDALPTSAARNTLLVLIASAEGDRQKALSTVETWYDSAMERVSGLYKRRVQWVMLGIAAAITLILGVDSATITIALIHEEGLRAAVAGAAQSASSTTFNQALSTLSALQLPIGWSPLPTTANGWLLKAVGLAVTALAASLGAPFWFDVLSIFTNPRQTGPKPQSVVNGQPAPPQN